MVKESGGYITVVVTRKPDHIRRQTKQHPYSIDDLPKLPRFQVDFTPYFVEKFLYLVVGIGTDLIIRKVGNVLLKLLVRRSFVYASYS
jgi:hypothetical protein